MKNCKKVLALVLVLASLLGLCLLYTALSSDRFYGDDGDMPEGWNANHGWKKMGVLAVEMEAAACLLYTSRCV